MLFGLCHLNMPSHESALFIPHIILQCHCIYNYNYRLCVYMLYEIPCGLVVVVLTHKTLLNSIIELEGTHL